MWVVVYVSRWVGMWVGGWVGSKWGGGGWVTKCTWSWVHNKYIATCTCKLQCQLSRATKNINLKFPYGLNLGLFFIIERRAPMTTAVNIAMTTVLLHMPDHRGNHWLLLAFTMDAREDTVTCSQGRHNHPQIIHKSSTLCFSPLNTMVNYRQCSYMQQMLRQAYTYH